MKVYNAERMFKDTLSPVRTRTHVAIQVERLVSGDMSQRHETPIHPSIFYVKMSQEEVLLTCAAYIYYAFSRKEIEAPKEGVDKTDKREPLMFPHVAASRPITGHVYRHTIFVAEHAGTSSNFVPIQYAATFVP
jgi:hypothetical protein